jgi:hypothetical protein
MMTFVVLTLAGFVATVLSAEALGLAPAISRWFTRLASRLLAEDDRDLFLPQWLDELAARQEEGQRLYTVFVALRFVTAGMASRARTRRNGSKSKVADLPAATGNVFTQATAKLTVQIIATLLIPAFDEPHRRFDMQVAQIIGYDNLQYLGHNDTGAKPLSAYKTTKSLERLTEDQLGRLERLADAYGRIIQVDTQTDPDAGLHSEIIG